MRGLGVGGLDRGRLRNLWVAWSLAALMLLVTGVAEAGVGGGGMSGLGGLGGGALGSLIDKIKTHLSEIAAVGCLAVGAAMAFARSAWMDMMGGIASVMVALVLAVWAAGEVQGGSLFALGAMVP